MRSGGRLDSVAVARGTTQFQPLALPPCLAAGGDPADGGLFVAADGTCKQVPRDPMECVALHEINGENPAPYCPQMEQPMSRQPRAGHSLAAAAKEAEVSGKRR